MFGMYPCIVLSCTLDLDSRDAANLINRGEKRECVQLSRFRVPLSFSLPPSARITRIMGDGKEGTEEDGWTTAVSLPLSFSRLGMEARPGQRTREHWYIYCDRFSGTFMTSYMVLPIEGRRTLGFMREKEGEEPKFCQKKAQE